MYLNDHCKEKRNIRMSVANGSEKYIFFSRYLLMYQWEAWLYVVHMYVEFYIRTHCINISLSKGIYIPAISNKHGV